MKTIITLTLFILTILILAQATLDPQYSISSPYWKHTGSAKLVGPNTLQLTSGRKRQKGAIWNQQSLPYSNWEITADFQISGKLGEGGEGMALWVLQDEPGKLGPVYGSHDKFNGLAVILDSKDNDDQRNNPAVSAHLLDGTIAYSHEDDGVSNQLAGCIADFRNRPTPVGLKVRYAEKSLVVSVDLGGHGNYRRCLKVDDFELDPKRNYYVGFSAQTTDEEDKHLIHNIVVDGLEESSIPKQTRTADATREKPSPMVTPSYKKKPVEMMHDKIDRLLRTTEGQLNPKELGEALDEIEFNLISQVNSHFVELFEAVDQLSDTMEQLSEDMDTMKSVDLSKLELAISDVKRLAGDGVKTPSRLSVPQGEKSYQQLFKEFERGMKVFVREYVDSRQEILQSTSSSGFGGFSFWLFIVLFQIMFGAVIAMTMFQTDKGGKIL